MNPAWPEHGLDDDKYIYMYIYGFIFRHVVIVELPEHGLAF